MLRTDKSVSEYPTLTLSPHGGQRLAWIGSREHIPSGAGERGRVNLSRALNEVLGNFALYPVRHRESLMDFFFFFKEKELDESCILKEQFGIMRVCRDEEHQRDLRHSWR